MKNSESASLLKTQNEQLGKLHKIVQDTINEQDLILNNLLHPVKETLTAGQSISDKVARFGGSWKFIIFFICFLTGWIAYNVISPKSVTFDPYPFILMNLLLSFIAALQAPIIMMIQNRQEEKDRMQNENDYLINLKAEMEIRSLHQKINLLLEEQIKTLFETQGRQFEILQQINSKLHKISLKK